MNEGNLNILKLLKVRKMYKKGFTGRGINVAIIDTGADLNHLSIKGRVIDFHNFTSNEVSNVFDQSGHGTHVAGIIGGKKEERLPMHGIAYDSNLIIFKIFGKESTDGYDNLTKALKKALAWRDQYGEKLDIINLSVGGKIEHEELKDLVKQIHAENILMVGSAGNYGDGDAATYEKVYPTYYNEVIQVGSLKASLRASTFSNSNVNLDFIAPGENILSSFPKQRYVHLSGTSMAAPHLTGQISILLQKWKEEGVYYDNDYVYKYLEKHAQSLMIDTTIQGNGLFHF